MELDTVIAVCGLLLTVCGGIWHFFKPYFDKISKGMDSLIRVEVMLDSMSKTTEQHDNRIIVLEKTVERHDAEIENLKRCR